MANTPREHTAHIVFGVRWTPESSSEVVGLKHQLDDAMLQDAIGRGRVQPTPRFTYYPLSFKGKQVGVLQIPVGSGGPYTPIKDFSKLQAGAIYYRRGTQNDRAIGTDLNRILKWFYGGGMGGSTDSRSHSWLQLFGGLHGLERGRTYLLVSDRFPSTTSGPIYSLGLVPWRAVIDFDPDSETSGLLNRVSGTLSRHRVVHKVVRGNYDVQPEPGTHWFFARGLTGRHDTLASGSHMDWLKDYKRELGRQLEALAGAISPAPVTALVLCSDAASRNYLRTLLEELHGAFRDTINVAIVGVSDPSLIELAESTDGDLVDLSFRSLCHGLANHFADLDAGNGQRHVLPSSSGAPINVDSEDWLWLSEDLELVHRAAGTAGPDDATDYRLGSDLLWRNLHLRHDCDRDYTTTIRAQVEADLRQRQTVRINLYHEPGGGGTTAGKRILWDLHNTFPVAILQRCTPRDTAERIARVSTLTESSVLVMVDGGRHSEREIEDLYDLLRASQTPVVLLQVLRRFQSQRTGKRQFWLGARLTDGEADRFRAAYARAAPAKGKALAALARQRNSEQRSAFFFGLTAFGRRFRGLRPYVENRTEGLSETQRRMLIYIAVAQYYGQQSVPAQAFATVLGAPRSRKLDLEAAFADGAAKALELLTESGQGQWRTAHHLIALEIMRRLLSPAGSDDRERVWRQNLSSCAKEFATFCQGDVHPMSDRLLELIRRVFIYRDNIEMLGTERAGQKQFAHLIEDIPSSHGKMDVLTHLTEHFPFEAHFHAHRGRLLSAIGEHDKAIECVDRALSLQADDQVLHHMRGMALRHSMRAAASAKAPVAQLIELAKEGSSSFEEARNLRPDGPHGYVSEVQMLISLVDYAGKDRSDVVRDVLARPGTDPFLKGALDRAEDLLDRVQHLHAGETPSQYVLDCRARLQAFYGNYRSALQAWDSLLGRPEVAKPAVRRQIVWTMLRRRGGVWSDMGRREVDRVRVLLEENLEEEVNDSTSLRLWLRAVRLSEAPPSVESILEKVSYWKANTGSLDAAYYLYVLHTLRALEGSSQGAAEAERALEECRRLARFRRDRTRSFEWIGKGAGVGALIHQSRLGKWVGGFWASPEVLVRLDGRVGAIDGPQKGYVELSGGVGAFFVPAKSGVHYGRDENARVECYLGFSYDGPRAWDVRLREG